MTSKGLFLVLINILFIQYSITANVENDSDDAKLLVVKNILNNYVVEGLNISIEYNIFNIGNVAALNVKLQDDNFPANRFEYLSGFSTVRWPKIPASSNVTHTAVVKPKAPGLFNFTHATVSYLANEKSAKVQFGYSTELGEVFISNLKEYNRRFASHTIDWILFAVMASPSIVFPYFLWYNSKRKYEQPKQRKDKSN